ncbi:uncharacterized protein CANTADRAFT_53805 [Suhomyces tanzawaensis NRRL Y-17324]|uniref:SAC domain-containing protein n=1 Tax=Suhomyces tanzawaensis NRRL Y-17324 TaxID=984487 RepID=A0A1E4SFP9_9ASCO|nr:uncharacterized protein CANTADRAFT_53805 [Suhomyces tanzawaensis NRRL Y-17324]ODV78232.1 hypothetical protein CANTADRAFT_53805 [Suhomyces tanzawaensis NRRL Y-17324]
MSNDVNSPDIERNYGIQEQDVYNPIESSFFTGESEIDGNIDESNVGTDGNESGATEDDFNQGPEFNNKRIILQRFTIYNSVTTMYIVGSNAKESLFRILEIGKDPLGKNLQIIEDKNYFYTRKDMVELLNGLDETIDGGIHKIAQGYGLLGLIKFTKGYYLSIITKCSQVAILGGHYIYHTDETKLIPLDINYRRPEKYSDEERLLSIFKYLDLGKTFYFSYAYDITNTLQTNFIRNKKLATKQKQSADTEFKLDRSNIFCGFEHNERFVWNNLLLKPILDNPDIATYEWFQPIIHGFIDQANISIYGKKFYITIIARRSHHFAGARFLKRGVNDKGNVANEIETEQIVSDMLVSSFHDTKYGFYNNPRFTSFVQHRGSIPLYWTQDLNRLPKPPIEINLSDPFYQSSALHFNNLFQRYGLPIIILNLIKTKEKQPRELKLNSHFSSCIKYLNQFLPQEHKLRYHSFDMSKHSKKNLDVITPLQNIASRSIEEIGFFHNGNDLPSTKLQKGILRTNCIDCLDRTNAAQFIICKEALTHQLKSLGLIAENRTLEYDSDLINILTEMFHDHGDTIAVQYGGSNLVNTMDSYRRINQWSSHTRDILNSVKRIYSNSFMDLIRQEAINLFLGNYIYDPNKPKLWELQNDFYLHNAMSIENIRIKPSYILWFNENFLSKSRFELLDNKQIQRHDKLKRSEPLPDYNDNWFNECYVPRKFQSLNEVFQFNMNSNARYFPSNINSDPYKIFDYSPFESRKIKSDDLLSLVKTNTHHETKSNDVGNIAERAKNQTQNNYLNEPVDSKYNSIWNKSNENSFELQITGSNSNMIQTFLSNKMDKLVNAYNSRIQGIDYDNLFQAHIVQPRVREDDEKLYSCQSDLPRLVSSRLLDSFKNDLTTIKTRTEDTEIYKYYTSISMQTTLSFFKEPVIPGQTNHNNQQDIKLYAKYLGIDEERDFDFNTEDEYFK